MLENPKIIIALIAFIIVILSYLLVYPRWARRDFVRLSIGDCISCSLLLAVVAGLYYGKDPDLQCLGIDFNWFWYACATYFAFEVPVAVGYCLKFGIMKEYLRSLGLRK